jgi:protein ImuB
MQHKKSNRIGHALLASVNQQQHATDESQLQVAEPASLLRSRRVVPSGATAAPRRTAAVALPNWSIQRLVVASPEYRRAPLVLFTETSNRGQLVTAASPRAQLSGVRVGMPLAEAKSLLRRAAGSGPLAAAPTFLPADPTADRRDLDSLARVLQDFSPLVGALAAPGSSGDLQFTIWLDLTGVAHLFGDLPGAELNLLRAVRDRLARCGTLAITAAADTPGAAWALANYARPARSEISATSEPAEGGERSDTQLPLFEPIIAPLKSGWAELDPLPPVALRLDPLICLTLGQLGISRIGQLRQLPRASLQARFGSQLGRRLDEVAGLASEVWAPLDESLDFAIDESFDFPLRDLATIQVVIERQLDQLCARLRPLQRGALQWQITLRGESAVKQTETSELEAEGFAEERELETSRQPVLVARLVINLFQPTATVAHVMQLIAMQLEQQRDLDLEETPVWEVTVRAARCVLLAEKQRLLFDDDPRLDQQALSQLLDRLAVRLGPERIVRPVPVSGAQPEFAFRAHVLVGNDQTPPRIVAPRREHAAISRPVRLIQPARPLAVAADETSGAPQQLSHSRWSARALAAWGPERIETGWWRGRLVQRDYWRVQTSDGQLLWVYRDLASEQWFLQGTF